MNGCKYVPVFLRDPREGLMHKSFDNSELITKNGYLLYFYTLSRRSMSHDIRLLEVGARCAQSTRARVDRIPCLHAHVTHALGD